MRAARPRHDAPLRGARLKGHRDAAKPGERGRAPEGPRQTVAPGGIKTDFAGRSLVLAEHPAYAALLAKVYAVFIAPARREQGTTAEQIAAVVYEAATDGKDQVTYVAGADAKALFAQRLAAGAGAFRRVVGQMFFG